MALLIIQADYYNAPLGLMLEYHFNSQGVALRFDIMPLWGCLKINTNFF
jgi:hypothetical protein